MTNNYEIETHTPKQTNSLVVEHVELALLRAVDAKDSYTAGHNFRVGAYATNLANQLGLDEDLIQTIGLGARMHDVGKIGVPDSILQKPGSLTAEEMDAVKKHCAIGQQMCETLFSDDRVLQSVRSHHERLNGKGYPDGLRGSEIPLHVQIVAIVDVIDALFTNRPYRDAMSCADVCNVIWDEASRGMHDKTLTRECLQLLEQDDLSPGPGYQFGSLDYVEQLVKELNASFRQAE